MDCQKARYFLVASFDDPLSDADRKDLSYHLKDCRACRHESFYYRELFSAEKQLAVRQPAADFNERLVSQIRLREARAAWPQVETKKPFRWSLVYVPALFGAVAAFSFLAFLPHRTETSAVQQLAVSLAPSAVTASATPEPGSPVRVPATARPRYIWIPRQDASSRSRVLFDWPLTGGDPAATDPFYPQLVSQPSPVQYMSTRSYERYVLPLVGQTTEPNRIY